MLKLVDRRIKSIIRGSDTPDCRCSRRVSRPVPTTPTSSKIPFSDIANIYIFIYLFMYIYIYKYVHSDV